MNRSTKIVATLGPASQDDSIFTGMVRAGLNVVRLNFSHGTYADHARSVEMVRRVSENLARPICLLQDLQGPKIRVGEFTSDTVKLEAGQRFILTTASVLGNKNLVSVDYQDLPASVSPGNRILLDDGNLELRVIEIRGDQVLTEVTSGGILKSHKGVNLPGARIALSALTPKDEADLAFGLENGVDAVALSFVRYASDIHQLRRVISRISPERKEIPIIAKLERPEALENLDEIIDAADGVMVARGDLGVELSPQAVPIAQKQIIAAANRHAKVVITATQMLETMITNRRPTRAEASDVANAIFDGTDAVMLSGETAVGKYPIESVEMMDLIICQAEEHLTEWGHWEGDLRDEAVGITTLGEVTHDDALSITSAARELAHDRNVAAIAVFTQTGRTALLMSKARPRIPILAFTPVKRTYNRLPMMWGVFPHLVPFADSLESMLESVEKAIISSTSIQADQQVVLISGFPVGALCPPNLALLHTIRGKSA
jgi:pyruvate kinase